MKTGKGSRVGAAPPSRAQRHSEPWLSGFIMLVKVQPEAKKPKTFIRAGRQQHQKLLHYALKTRKSIFFRREPSTNTPPPSPPQPHLGWFLLPDQQCSINTHHGRCPKGRTTAPGTQVHRTNGSRVRKRYPCPQIHAQSTNFI